MAEITPSELSNKSSSRHRISASLSAPVFAPPPQDEPPKFKRLADFILMEQLGVGGMGTVFKARQISLDRFVAVKILSRRLARNPENIERFIRGARASAMLCHPNIVQCIGVGEENGMYYQAMELLAGETVLQRFKRLGPLPLPEVVEIGVQTAMALSHAHGRGILHRDVKPENLMLVGDPSAPTVKLMDLGLARPMDDDASVTQIGLTVGTPLYISPEQARGLRNLTPAADLYSLGAMLLHMVSGKPPFDGLNGREVMALHSSTPVPDPKQYKADLPDAFCAVLRKLMAKQPEDRFATADDLAAVLRQIQGKPQTKKTKLKLPRVLKGANRLRRRKAGRGETHKLRWSPLAIAVLLIVVLAVANFGLQLLPRSSTPAPAPTVAAPGAPVKIELDSVVVEKKKEPAAAVAPVAVLPTIPKPVISKVVTGPPVIEKISASEAKTENIQLEPDVVHLPPKELPAKVEKVPAR